MLNKNSLLSLLCFSSEFSLNLLKIQKFIYFTSQVEFLGAIYACASNTDKDYLGTEWICEYQEWDTSGLMLEHWSEGENIP